MAFRPKIPGLQLRAQPRIHTVFPCRPSRRRHLPGIMPKTALAIKTGKGSLQSAFDCVFSNMIEFESVAHQAWRLIHGKTKPRGSLGKLEALAAQIAAVQGSLAIEMERTALIVFMADHGIVKAGVSAWPQAITLEMARNFLAGGAAATAFARKFDIPVTLVDAGMCEPMAHPQLLDRRIGSGTANFAHGPAMTAAQCETALGRGRKLARETPCDVLCLGEMGIGNTSSAAMLAHKLLGLPLPELIGPGAGLDAGGVARKRAVLRKAAARTPARLEPVRAMAEYGGFEIAMLAGAMLGAAQSRRLVLVDGFIATAAALAALQLESECRASLVFSHESAEPGHRLMLEAISAEPLLQLDLRLGEGTGALLAWPLLRAAGAILSGMASFEDAGVSGKLP